MADIILVMPLANRFDKVSFRIPCGLLAIAAIPDSKGYDVKIIDLKTDDGWQTTLSEAITNDTICVGITCSTGRMITSALDIAGKVRELNPSLPIVFGGPHPTLLPSQTLAHPLVDLVVINEGDETFFKIIDALENNKAFDRIEGIGYKNNGQIFINPPAPLIKELDSLPLFPYSLLDIPRYSSLSIENRPSLDVLTSRGCPFNCGFCSTPLTSHRKWRSLSIEKVMENIVALHENFNIGTFYFLDDNFMVDLKRVEEILDALKREKLDIYWGAQGVRVDTINRMSSRLLEKIERSGCRELSIGVESASPEILKTIDKKIKLGISLKPTRSLQVVILL